MPGLLERVESQNVTLSDNATRALKDAGYSEIKTLDQLVAAMVKTLDVNAKINSISERLDKLTAENLPSKASAYGLKSGSVEASTLGSRKAMIIREGDNLTYDFNEIIKGVPADKAVVGSVAVITGGNGGGRYVDSGNTGVLPIPSSGSSLKMEVTIQTKKGIITLSNTALVPETDGSQEITLGVNDYTTSIADMSTAEHLDVLSAEVAALKQRILG